MDVSNTLDDHWKGQDNCLALKISFPALFGQMLALWISLFKSLFKELLDVFTFERSFLMLFLGALFWLFNHFNHLAQFVASTHTGYFGAAIWTNDQNWSFELTNLESLKFQIPN